MLGAGPLYVDSLPPARPRTGKLAPTLPRLPTSRRTEMRTSLALTAFLLAPAANPRAQEPWTTEALESNAQGFLAETWTPRLEQVAKLLATRAPITAPLSAVVHGDHREYIVKIRALVDGLTHERWLERERAERSLVEIGGRARDLLRERAQTGATLEERVRTQRILDRITERGTEEEDRRLKLLRGFVLTALYLPEDPRLREALVNARGHSDHSVAQGAVRALGRHGTAAEVPALGKDAANATSPVRLAALCALSRIIAPEALVALGAMLRADQLSDVEAIHVLRCVRERADAAELITLLRGSKRPAVAAAAALTLPPAGAPQRVQVALADRTEFKVPLHGMVGDSLLLGSPVAGLPHFEAPFAQVAAIQVAEPERGVAPLRAFLQQGTLLAGSLVGLDADTLTLRSGTLGDVRVARKQIQGLLTNPEADRLVGASAELDRVRLVDGKTFDGDVVSLDPTAGLTLRTANGEQTIRGADLQAVTFRRPQQIALDPVQLTRLTMRNGERLLGHVAAIDTSNIALVIPAMHDPILLAQGVVPIGRIATIELLVGGGTSWGYTIVADYSENRIVELDEKGREVFAMNDVFGAWDVECLDNGNLLVTEFAISRVQEITRGGQQVWAFEDLKNPYDADRLPNGNTLIADSFGMRVIEVNKAGKIVWQFADDVRPFDCDRLANGNTLIADVLHERIIEVNPEGKITWELRNMKLAHDADRLPNGNTLITLREAKRVVEVDRDGQVVWELRNLNHPSDADRLPNGNTLVAENGMVREFDRNGNEVWRKAMTWAVEANRY